MEERIHRYLERADEARELSARIERREARRSLTLLAAMWTALARHALRSGTDTTADESQSF
jgi:hypothetical protein